MMKKSPQRSHAGGSLYLDHEDESRQTARGRRKLPCEYI
jgi:hypothetical protein